MTIHVVTGAGSGIGRVVAERLRDRGDRLVLLVRDGRRVADLRPDFPEATFVEADLAEPTTLHGLGRSVEGDVASLIHCAGAIELGPLASQRLDDWQLQLDVNLTAPAMLTRELLPHLRRGRGTVVFVNSGAGLNAHADWGAYAASKHGLRAVADALRAEEAAHGIRVSSVFPGRTATAMQEKVHTQEGADYHAEQWIRPDTVAATILHVIDLPGDATIPDVTLRPSPRTR